MCAAGVFASPSPKNASASVTDIAEHLADVLAAEPYSSTDAWKRLPPHSSQVVATPAMIASSV